MGQSREEIEQARWFWFLQLGRELAREQYELNLRLIGA